MNHKILLPRLNLKNITIKIEDLNRYDRIHLSLGGNLIFKIDSTRIKWLKLNHCKNGFVDITSPFIDFLPFELMYYSENCVFFYPIDQSSTVTDETCIDYDYHENCCIDCTHKYGVCSCEKIKHRMLTSTPPKLFFEDDVVERKGRIVIPVKIPNESGYSDNTLIVDNGFGSCLIPSSCVVELKHF